MGAWIRVHAKACPGMHVPANLCALKELSQFSLHLKTLATWLHPLGGVQNHVPKSLHLPN